MWRIGIVAAFGLVVAGGANGEVVATNLGEFEAHVEPFLAKHCVGCHGADKQKADFAVHDIDGLVTGGKDTVRWEKVLEMVSLGDMPPEDETQPTKVERSRIVGWVAAELKKIGRGYDEAKLALPREANRVEHEALFSGEHTGPAFSPSRLWRKSPPIYQQFSREMRVQLSQPFMGMGGKGIQDYASLMADESTIKTMLRNANLVAEDVMGGDRGRLKWLFEEEREVTEEDVERGVGDLFKLVFQREATGEDRERYVDGLFAKNRELGGLRVGMRTLIMGMLMSPEFVFRMEVGTGEVLADGRRMLSGQEMAYALSYAIFDQPQRELVELAGEGKLSTREDVEREVRRLLEREDERRRYWHYPMYHRWGEDYYAEAPRVLRFFQEFFGYTGAVDVFKDRERDPDHHALRLRKDADLLVLSVLEKDEWVLEELLTTRRYVVDYFSDDKMGKVLEGKNQRQLDHLKNKYGERFEEIAATGKWPGIDTRHVRAYNITEKKAAAFLRGPGELIEFPEHERAGMLTHPAWLVAHSGNFDNDPIRRGKWIRERLLAGVVPEVPIGVDAKVPEDPERTLRERLDVVEKEECWRCHKHMNPLGIAFESYDDFGRFRERIVVGDADGYFKAKRKYEGDVKRTEQELAKWLKLDAAGRAAKVVEAEGMLAKLVEPEEGIENYPAALRRYEGDLKRWTNERKNWMAVDDERQASEIARYQKRLDELEPPVADDRLVEAVGELKGTGDPVLDGEVTGAVDLVERLAKSERVRQSFVRHAFRFWMGRNETLDDSPTLMAADRAYVESGGSFRELLVSLLTSDSFLMRR
ncbi:MAG: DUF1588 domain-containing protein [Verrucomicrobiales bacterium]|nr:DUF1588 domain-containing protein [Verrucomicrobiales bacterium]